jgi:uncharacterized protein YeaO (DUF488 family)
MGTKPKGRAKAPASPAAEPALGGEFSSPACYLHEFAPQPPSGAAGIGLKRVQEPHSPSDGYRVLVDRLWPRGISKARAALDAWRADLAPSTPLRQWYHRDLNRWEEFRRRYRNELRGHASALEALRERAARERVTLLYAARDPERNHARVLREVLRKQPRARGRRSG